MKAMIRLRVLLLAPIAFLGLFVIDGGRSDAGKCQPGYIVLDKPNKYGSFCEQLPKDQQAEQPQERACPPGYVVLEKPNKYGSYCEPVGQGQPQAQSCPDGQMFFPNQGCLRETNCVTNTPESAGDTPMNFQTGYLNQCSQTPGTGKCTWKKSTANPNWTVVDCCCYVK